MSFRLASLRHLARAKPLSLRPLNNLRPYATPSNPPEPSSNSPPPIGLESLFGGKRGKAVAPKPAGVDSPSGPSLPKKPDVGLPGLEGDGKEERQSEEHEEEARRPRLSDFQGGKAGMKSAMGGGGGGSGGGGTGGGPGGFGGMSPNQLFLAAIRFVQTNGSC